VNIPNLLTVLRFFIVPVFGYFLYVGQYVEAMSLFLLAGFTDILDGYIARKFDIITSFGEFMDPFADKLIQATAITVLCINGVIPFLVIIIVAVKELIMAWGAVVLYRDGKIVVPANWYGKLATCIFYIAIFYALMVKLSGWDFAYNSLIINSLFGLAILTTLYALLKYYLNFKRLQREKILEQNIA
jgi:cardiolipin synthase